MEPVVPSNKRVLVIGGMLLVVFVALIYAFLSSRQANRPPTAQPSTQVSDLSSILSYQPPADAKYTALGDVNFIPSKINSITIDRAKVLSQAQASYPDLTQMELVKTINQAIFYWMAINDYYNSAEKNLVTPLYKSGVINDFTAVDNEFHKMAQDYTAREIKLDGFFVRVRFEGVRPENIQKLGKKESELKPLAQTLINDFRSESQKFTEKERIVAFANESRQAELLNNGEKSQTFSNRSLYPPLVSDPNYYTWAQRLLVGQFSDVMTLNMYNAQKKAQENYAYVFFYLSKKSGNHLPLNILGDQFVKSADLK